MDKSMTGDGAVVRDALTPEQTARWMEATAKCMKHPGDAIPVAALQAGARYIRQQAAEIERLTRERDEEKERADGNYQAFERVRTARADADTRTADLLKALKPFAALDVSEIQPDPARGTYLIEQGAIRNARAAIAAAKGETV